MGFDIIGDIAIFSTDIIKEEAEKLLREHKNIKVVLKKVKEFSGKYRLSKYEFVVGEKRKETLYIESGIKLKLDVEKCYFSPRLNNERLRIAKQIKKGEDVLVMFSGVAPYPLVFANHSKARMIFGIELNKTAHKYALENLRLNKFNNVVLYCGDVHDICKQFKKEKIKFDRIVMPLPKGAGDYLSDAFSVLKNKGLVHFYSFAGAEELDKLKGGIKAKCLKLKKKIKILKLVKCGQYAPRKFRVCVDFKIL